MSLDAGDWLIPSKSSHQFGSVIPAHHAKVGYLFMAPHSYNPINHSKDKFFDIV